jgi:NADPH-dependent glutamate synthase beta subunit-like oxidoreductase/2,4-dienoyl-CoA reductase-like NADH-dependent reductase (Old Yellow Enzyme family)
VEIPGYQPFYISSPDDLRAEIARLGLGIPVEDDPAALAAGLTIGRTRVPNRFCAQPIAGGDAEATGAPGELTRRRYIRAARGGFGLIWVEMTAAGPPEKSGQLGLHEETVLAFAALLREMRDGVAEKPVVILQLAAERLEKLIRAALLAAEAGFDGVDLQCARDALPMALAELQKQAPGLLLTTRLCVYEANRGGFGVSVTDYRQPDLAGPIDFVRRLRDSGLALLNVTAASPALSGTARGVTGKSDAENPDEHPLTTLNRQLRLAHSLRAAFPALPVVGSGWSWLRQFVPQVAAGALRAGMIDFAGLGRGALAHPSLPQEVLAHGALEGGEECMICGACSQLRAAGEVVGCVLRDPEVYGPVYRHMRRFDGDSLLAGAHRCHLCEAAPCIRASPTGANIPAFIQAFRQGDESGAYEILRERDPLPELTAQFSPAWLESEGACIETTLTGTPVPILDLQLAIAWRARGRGQTGVRLPAEPSGKSVAIVGGGPTGLAATIRLLELGYSVDLYEQSQRLGGVPERVLAAHRHLSSQAEIEAILSPALAAGRLRLNFGVTLSGDLALADLRRSHSAVLVATGLWQQRSLGTARGVLGGLVFLESSGLVVPDRVAILAGGDSAMDAARVVQSRGAKEIFVVFGGPRSAMHWHMPESWLATPGVHAMMHWQPLSYETDRDGQVCGVRLRHAKMALETVLPVGMVIEAMGVEGAHGVRAALAAESGHVYTAGALVNGGASVGQCVAEGFAIAGIIHRDLSS